MFDVRPLNERGELDMAKIKRIEAVLDLLYLSKSEWAEIRKNFKAAAPIRREKELGGLLKRPRRKTRTEEVILSESISVLPKKISLDWLPDFGREISEAVSPERDEILFWLEEIDRLDGFLKSGAELEEEKIFSPPQLRGGFRGGGVSEILSAPPPRLASRAKRATPSSAEEGEGFNPIPLFNDGIVFEAPIEREELIFPMVENEYQPEEVLINRQADQPPLKKLSAAVFKKGRRGFIAAAMAVFLVMFGLSTVGQGISAKSNILSSALSAYRAMLAAKDSAGNLDFSGAQVNFETAYQEFLMADQELNKMGRALIYLLEKLPGGSIVGSGAALVETGESLAKAGNIFSQIANLFIAGNFDDLIGQESLTRKMSQAISQLKAARAALEDADKSLGSVKLADLPVAMVEPVNALKEKLPIARRAAQQLEFWGGTFLDILGEKQAKKYLLIFQNNSEARATGGFIGTYGVLDLDQGRIKNLFIDGIFNLDGQLNEKIIPPEPIQKISSVWSTHDANWFADWPVSARKIMWFYEKAGGATADGVISITPTVIERLLELTGPIEMPAYGAVLDKNNFLEVTQYKVEIDYDKRLNQPKKILADFAPLFLDHLWQVWPDKSKEILTVILDSLVEKHILFYFSDKNLQSIFEQQGWAGKILATDKDYLSVVNTNINGYKTDKMVEQKIEHQAEIIADGSIINTVQITRTHHGGVSQYDYYNKVNADYLRVMVPLGSRLLSAHGQTRETINPPLNYEKLGFKRDADVAAQEDAARIDGVSGTRIFEEAGKTVFANWVYVSPGESATIIYRYILPFSLNLTEKNVSYSLMAQKQAGSLGSDFESILKWPANLKISWQYPDTLQMGDTQVRFAVNLNSDKFYGVVFAGR